MCDEFNCTTTTIWNWQKMFENANRAFHCYFMENLKLNKNKKCFSKTFRWCDVYISLIDIDFLDGHLFSIVKFVFPIFPLFIIDFIKFHYFLKLFINISICSRPFEIAIDRICLHIPFHFLQSNPKKTYWLRCRWKIKIVCDNLTDRCRSINH